MNEQASSMTLTTSEELEQVVQAARDSMTDDMVGRVAATLTGAMDLLDQVDRSGLVDAIPALSKMVANGDLDRLVELARVVSSAQDAMTDDMVDRLAYTATSSIDFLDQVNRAGLNKAIPALAKMVNNGDLDRIVDLARVVSSAQDAMTDDMVNRLAMTFSQGVCTLDRMCRYGGIDRMINLLERLEVSGSLEKLAVTLPPLLDRLEHVEGVLNALEQATSEMESGKPSPGGLGGMWKMMRDKDNQEVIRYMLTVGKKIQTSTPQP
jgi:uncharacterized protein YjgD (DUF1641 family)